MTARYELTLPLDGVTLLTPNTRRRMGWRQQSRLTREQRAFARMLAAHSGAPQIEGGSAFEHRDIYMTLVRGKGQRLVDLDALGSACKAFLDGIGDAGLIRDDSPAYCTPHYAQERGPKPLLRVGIVS